MPFIDLIIAIVVALSSGASWAADAMEPISPLPITVSEDPQRVELGARLFADVQLSHGNVISCAGCHPLNRGGVDGRARAVSLDGKKLLRNTPTVFNLRFNLYLNWDGAHESLHKHTEAVLLNPSLMNTTWSELLGKLNADRMYAPYFRSAYPQGVTRESVLDAIVSFERSLTTPNAPIDRYLRGQRDALTADEISGYQLFKSNGCVACHQGVNIGGNLVQRFGVFAVPGRLGNPDGEPDPGRFRVTHDPLDKEVFRVPSLRNVALTAPYFHDGRATTLEQAVDLMARVQLGRALNGQDIRLIVAFLRTLTGEVNGQVPKFILQGNPP
jgi:cytochrome c peroxidase